jgi:hypothetical protein
VLVEFDVCMKHRVWCITRRKKVLSCTVCWSVVTDVTDVGDEVAEQYKNLYRRKVSM